MKSYSKLVLAFASLVSGAAAQAANYPGTVVSYVPGGLPESLASYTNSAILLREPARTTPGAWGGPVDPFSPPYLNTQLLSIGTNGSVTLAFDQPVVNKAGNPFGADLVLYGNTGFIITNGDYSGGGITDGALFGGNGTLRVSVSRDNVQYFPLKPAIEPAVMFPTDGSGEFGVAVDPSLQLADFAGKGYAGIRELYHGAAGGSAFDLDWARNTAGDKIALSNIRYVRIEAVEGHVELGGLAAAAVDADAAYELNENFSADPAVSGWQMAGDASLFHWNAAAGSLEAAWDSSKANSYFHRVLPRAVTADDSFSAEFDLTIQDIAAGVNPDKQFAFELAAGFIHLNDALSGGFLRGTGSSSPNLVEFDYFPDTGFGATISPVIVSGSNQIIPSFTFPLELAAGKTYRLAMSYVSSNRTMSVTAALGGASIGAIKDVVLPANFSGFTADAFSVSSYSDTGAGGSILAHGIIDNVKISIAARQVFQITGVKLAERCKVRFDGSSRRKYALERSVDLKTWSQIADWTLGIDSAMELSDPSATNANAFYRVKMQNQ